MVKSLNDDDQDEGPSFGMGGAPIFGNKPIAKLHNLYLVGSIKDASYYVQWFDLIRTAREHDVIYIHINSSGGDGWTALQLLRVMNESSATIVASVEGMCMSAATFIMLSATKVEISNHSMFMFHNFSGMVAGKGGEMFDQVTAGKQWSTKLLHDMYKHFLTAEEIKSILENRDMWLNSDQVIERLKKRSELQLEEVKKREEEAAKKKPLKKSTNGKSSV